MKAFWLCTGATQNYSVRRTHRGCPNHHDPRRHQSARRRCATVAANACVPKEPPRSAVRDAELATVISTALPIAAAASHSALELSRLPSH